MTEAFTNTIINLMETGVKMFHIILCLAIYDVLKSRILRNSTEKEAHSNASM